MGGFFRRHVIDTLYDTCGQTNFPKKSGFSWMELTFSQLFYTADPSGRAV